MQKIILFLFLILIYQAGSQSLSVFDIDTTDFPIMRAKFYAFDSDGKQILGLQASDFEVTENDEQREVLNISCPTPQSPTAISSVLTIDVSGSMTGNSIEMAKEAAKSWVNALPLGKSECAITSFTSENQYIQDFTTNRNKLLQKLQTLSNYGDTDFNAAFINPIAGGLIVLEKAKHKKVMVLITDGYAAGNEDKILSKALSMDATFYCVTLGFNCPIMLKNIAEETGGMWFENITSIEEAKETYNKILHSTQGNSACTIEWSSKYRCKSDIIRLDVENFSLNLTGKVSYPQPLSGIAKLLIEPSNLFFQSPKLNQSNDTTIVVTAIGNDIDVSNISSSDNRFDIQPKQFSLKKNESLSLTVSFTPENSAYVISELEFKTQFCSSYLFCSGNKFKNNGGYNRKLTLLAPNGNEQFLVGTDTLISWSGVLPSDTVSIEYSIDNGISWQELLNNADNLKSKWVHIPFKVSDNCLVRIHTKSKENSLSMEWTNSFGGSLNDSPNSIIQCKDGGYLIAGYSNSNNWDISKNNGDKDIVLLKINSKGQIEWDKTFGGSKIDIASKIINTLDGGYILAGSTTSNDKDVLGNHGNSDAWILKLNSEGNIEWKKCYGGSLDDKANDIIQSKDGGYIFVGQTNSIDGDIIENFGDYDTWTVKISQNGDIKWQQVIGGYGTESAYSVLETFDNNIVIAGVTKSNNLTTNGNYGMDDVLVIKMNPMGNVIWKNNYGGSNLDNARSIIETQDKNYIFTGQTYSFDYDVSGNKGYYDAWLVKIDSNGEIDWQKCLGGIYEDAGLSIKASQNGNLVLAGNSRSKDGLFSENHGEYDTWISYLDQDGNLLWQKLLGGSSNEFLGDFLINNYSEIVFTSQSSSNDFDVPKNHDGSKSTSDIWVAKIESITNGIQSDTSDAVFSIVAPEVSSQDINMGDVVVNSSKDSVITEFFDNIGQWDCRIDTIYFEGADADYFGLNGPNPVYSVAVGEKQMCEFKFTPTEVRDYSAQVVVVTQADTLTQNIYGHGVAEQIVAYSEIIDFGIGEMYNNADSSIVLIENVTPEPIDITKIEMLGPDNEQFIFRDSTQIQPFTLAGNKAYSLNISFNPKYIGRTSGQVAFHFNGAGSPAIAQLYGAGIGAEVSASTDSALVGGVVGIDIKIENNGIEKFSEMIGSFEGLVRVESSLLSVINEEDLVETKADSAYVKFKGEINNEGNILTTIPFKVEPGLVESTSIDFEYLIWFDKEGNEFTYDTEFTSGLFKKLKPTSNTEEKVAIFNLSPNPAENRIQIDFSVIEVGYTEITLVNMLGKTVATFFAEDISDFQDRQIIQDISEIGSGHYILQFKTPTYVERRKVMVVR